MSSYEKVKLYKHKKIQWYNISNSFDIETTSFYDDGLKKAIMYTWQWAIGTEFVVYGREWSEFNEFISILSKTLGLNDSKRIVCFVHNLGYEMQFFKHYFTIYNLLALKPYKPIKFSTSAGIDFRCSYILTNQSLSTLSKNYNLKYYKKPNYDYSKIRNSKTKLTDAEIDYIVSDVLAVNEYIQKEIDVYGKISRIPNTSTGKVRNQTRQNTIELTKMGGNDNHGAFRYRHLIQELTLEPEEFALAHSAYAGGLTHSNAENTDVTLYNVGSMDFTSSYPAVMVLFGGFPMSKGKRITQVNNEEFYHYIHYYACIFSITFFNIQPKVKHENIISINKCTHITSDRVINNGRVYSAGALTISLTDMDFKAIDKFYTWDKMIINDMWIYRKGFLPKKLVESVLYYYENKTKLKGLNDELSKTNYLLYKGYVNSLYGMCCLNPCKPEIKYENNGEWSEEFKSLTDMVERYNNDKNRFLSYLWGIYISSVARYNLCVYGILPFAVESGKSDYIYADTDSVKFMNPEKHFDIFRNYNTYIMNKIKYVSKKRKIPIEKFMPVTQKGEPAVIGVWSYEGKYNRFKTLGAKRYFSEKDDKYELTVAGLGKKAGCNYICSLSDNPFEIFTNELYVPGEFTGKQTHTYCEYEINGELKDYQGNTAHYHEMSFIHLEDADYDFNISAEYIKFLRGIKDETL